MDLINKEEFVIPGLADLNVLDAKVINKVHIRIQPRGNRKYVTVIENLKLVNSEISIESALKIFQKKLSCGGHIADDNIILNGDKRADVRIILILNSIVDKSNIIIHGF
jgi:translation initiation factor SUI1